MSLALTRPPAPALREFGYWLHRYRRTWRGTIVISVVNPLLFLTAMGVGLGKLVNHENSGYLHGAPYLSFVAPGLLAAAAMQTAVIESGGAVYQSARSSGNYRAAAATSMRPVDIHAGHLLFMGFRILLSSAAFTVVITVFGVVSPLRALLLIPVCLLIGAAFIAPLTAYAITVTRPSRLSAVFRFVIMPLYMFSGTFYPISQLPTWLHDIIACTPLYWGIQLCRTIVLGTADVSGTVTGVLYLGVLATAGYLVGRRTFQSVLNA